MCEIEGEVLSGFSRNRLRSALAARVKVKQEQLDGYEDALHRLEFQRQQEERHTAQLQVVQQSDSPSLVESSLLFPLLDLPQGCSPVLF